MRTSRKSRLSRRKFLQTIGAAAAAASLQACSQILSSNSTRVVPTFFQAFTNTPTSTPAETPTPTSTPEPTRSPVEQAIAQQGAAQRIPAIEYHGLLFSMEGVGQMTPEWFEDQMRWLSENDFHAVTRDELNGYLHGDTLLPAKSILLTFDWGSSISNQVDTQLAPILKKYGMHGLGFIQAEDRFFNTELCPQNACWSHYRNWANSGIIDFGSHTINHYYLSQQSYSMLISELADSKKRIEDNLGVEVDSLAWPFEDVPSTWAQALTETGYRSAFGGWSRPIAQCQVQPHDPLWGNLPRLLPYSWPDSYPKLTARTPGITFPELVMANITPLKDN
jgi:peptidoglycan/xylan/chitin deacetylase (PgdA/CDA1 family)